MFIRLRLIFPALDPADRAAPARTHRVHAARVPGALAVLSGGVQNGARSSSTARRALLGGDATPLERIVRPLEFTRT